MVDGVASRFLLGIDTGGTYTDAVLFNPEEGVKARAEEKAAAAGQSLNTWMVNVVRSATNDHSINVDIDLSSVPFVGYDPFAGNRRQGQGNRRMSGWL